MTATSTAPSTATSTATSTMVAAAAATIDPLPPQRFAAEADDASTVVVDVREADERAASGSIAGAIHVPRGLIEFRADPTNAGHDARLHPATRVLLYCDDGARSALAAAALQRLGYTDVAHLDGGLRAWEEAQLPLFGRVTAPY